MRSVITIGNFDGVHRGHTALIDRARRIAAANRRPAGADASDHTARTHATGVEPEVVALVFDPHPATVLRPGSAPPRLTTFEQREGLLREAGADSVVRLEPTRELLGLTPEAFADCVVREYAPVAFVEGADFRFGRGRAGDTELLRRLGERHGFAVEVVEPVEAVLSDQTAVTASSTLVRSLIGNGRVTDAAAVLGRPYSVVGRVVRGDRRGRGLGYPTANIDTPCLIPADGVYAGRALLGDGRTFAAAVSVGTKPQFDGQGRALEAFLLVDGDSVRTASWTPIAGLPEYGWGIELEFLGWVRDQARFESVEALLAQMDRDCERVRAIAAAAAEEVGA